MTPYHSTHTGAQVDQAVDRANIMWEQTVGRQTDGTWNLTANADVGTVYGLGLNFTPIRGFLQVESPNGGYLLFANIDAGSFTFDGFSFSMSGAPDSGLYKLHFLLFGPVPATGSSGESGSSNAS